MAPINHFDLAFIIDTTGSMGGLIKAAQKQMVEMIDMLSKESKIDMRFGVVEYRVHPPQEIAEQLNATPSKVGSSVCRLQSRGLLVSSSVTN